MGLMRRMTTGLNIVDLLVAMLLVTILTGVAIPVFYSQPRITLDHAAILLANDLRYTQNEAAICGETTVLTFDESGDGYAVSYKSGRPVANPVGGQDLVREYSIDAIFRGVTVELLDGEGAVSFDRNGFAVTPVTVRLHYEDDTRTLKLAEGSGMVQIEGLETSWKDDGL